MNEEELLQIAEEFFAAYELALSDANATDSLLNLVADNLVVSYSGEAGGVLPFAGLFVGPEGLDDVVETIRTQTTTNNFEVEEILTTTYAVDFTQADFLTAQDNRIGVILEQESTVIETGLDYRIDTVALLTVDDNGDVSDVDFFFDSYVPSEAFANDTDQIVNPDIDPLLEQVLTTGGSEDATLNAALAFFGTFGTIVNNDFTPLLDVITDDALIRFNGDPEILPFTDNVIRQGGDAVVETFETLNETSLERSFNIQEFFVSEDFLIANTFEERTAAATNRGYDLFSEIILSVSDGLVSSIQGNYDSNLAAVAFLGEDPFAPDEVVTGDSSFAFNNDNTFSLPDATSPVNLQFSLSGVDAGFVNEVAIYRVEEGQTTEDIVNSGQVIFSALSQDSLDFLTSEGFSNPLRTIAGFDSDDELGFYLVANSTTEAVQAGQASLDQVILGDANNLRVTEQGVDSFLVEFEDGGGSDFDDLQLVLEITEDNAPIGSNLQTESEIIDLTSLPSQSAIANINVSQKNGSDNVGGLYLITNENGAVFDAVTGQEYLPGDEGYVTAALNNSVVDFSELNANSTLISGGFFYAPYLLTDGDSSQFYSPFSAANADGLDHLRLGGDNVFAFEDDLNLGNGDFNDFVFEVNFTVV